MNTAAEPNHSCYQCGYKLKRAIYYQVNFPDGSCEVTPVCPHPDPCSYRFRETMKAAGLMVYRTTKEKWKLFPCP